MQSPNNFSTPGKLEFAAALAARQSSGAEFSITTIKFFYRGALARAIAITAI